MIHLSDMLADLENSSPIHTVELGLHRMHRAVNDLSLTDWSDCTVVTVAGTNGKGSTCTFLRNISLKHHVSTGLFTSPHLLCFNERFNINGGAVNDDHLARVMCDISRYSKAHNPHLTYFEKNVLIALQLFKQSAVKLLILEVGLGGRLDAVNVIDNDISIITSIGLDHQQYLGDTLDQIAREKSGIIKFQTKVVLPNDIPEICCKTATELQCSVSQLEQTHQITHFQTHWQLNNLHSLNRYHLEPLSMSGQWQRQNASLAIMAWEWVCKQRTISLNHSCINQALKHTQLTGRLSSFRHPAFTNFSGWLEVGHNPQAVAAIIGYLKSFGNGAINIMFSCYKDKDSQAILLLLSQISSSLHLVELQSERSNTIQTLSKLAKQLLFANIFCYGLNQYKTTRNAVQAAIANIHTANTHIENTNEDNANPTLIIGSFELIEVAANLLRLDKDHS